jgi:hypothetical protein
MWVAGKQGDRQAIRAMQVRRPGYRDACREMKAGPARARFACRLCDRRPRTVREVKSDRRNASGRAVAFVAYASPRSRRPYLCGCLLECASRAISKHRGDGCFSRKAAVSAADGRRPLSASCLQRNGFAASDLARMQAARAQNGAARSRAAQPSSSPIAGLRAAPN